MSNFDPSFVAGCIAGSANIVTGYPFDTVKVRIQASQCIYSGPWSCFKSIIKQEGIRGLFRGLSAPLIGGALETGINYAVFENTLQYLQKHRNITDPTIAVPVSAATAAVFLSFVISPVELVKCRMQLGAADPLHTYKTPLDCIKQVVKQEGLWGLTRGFGATLCREIPGNIVYFSTYRILRELLPGKPKQIQQHDYSTDTAASAITASQDNTSLVHAMMDASSTIACGAASGMFMWVVVQPLDVVKTRIQTTWPGSNKDYGILEHLKVLYRQGRRSLYAGLSPTLIRAAPANAAQWMAYEFCIREWERLNE